MEFAWLKPYSHLYKLITPIGMLLAMGCDIGAGNGSTVSDSQQSERVPTLIRVRVIEAVEEAVSRSGAMTGIVVPFRKAVLASETGGRVVTRMVEPGDAVESGQALIILDSEKSALALAQAEALADTRRVDVAQGQAEYDRGLGLYKRNVVSDDTLDDLRFALERATSQLATASISINTAKRNLRDSEIKAPFAGTAEVIHVQVGDFVNIGTPVATIADFSRARVIAGITASEAANLDTRGQARLSFETLGGTVFIGQIQSLGRISNHQSGTYPVEIWLDQKNSDRLREGMVASVSLPLSSKQLHLVVPRAALFRREGSTHLYTVSQLQEPAIVQLRVVRTGNSNGKVVEILDGLVSGELVVVEGLFALRDGAAVTIESAN